MSSRQKPQTTPNPYRTIYQKSLAAIVDSSDDAILSKTLTGIIVSWNKGAERIYGYTEEEIVGKSVSILVPEGRPNEIPDILRRLEKGEIIEHYEARRKRKDGTIIDVSLTISPVKDDSGKIIGASAIARDITERKRLQDLRNFLASIVDCSDDAIFSKDLNGVILSWNKGAERLYGYSKEEIVGRNVVILMPPDRKDEVHKVINTIKNGKVIENDETVRLKKSGDRFDISLRVSPVLDSEGKVIAASIIARDITNRKKTEAEMTLLMDTLARSLEQKNLLLQEVYHRVKNNLQVVGSLLQLRSRDLRENPDRAIAAFEESVSRIRTMGLIHESLYKTENLDNVDFLVFLRSLSDQLLTSYSREKAIEIRISGQAHFYGLDMAIPLGLIFNELITNSLKYAFTDSSKGCIEINFNSENSQTKVRIADNGIGLAKNFNFKEADSFGFKIIKLLTSQISAEMFQIPEDRGTVFELRFSNSWNRRSTMQLREVETKRAMTGVQLESERKA